ncbi:MAG: glycosyltransferase [Calditrichia bacterium]
MAIKYSVIIPVYNREDELSELLQSFSLLRFDSDKCEIIVVDDGSVVDLSQVINKFKPKIPFDLVYHRQENQGPAQARNTGMKLARGEYYIFLDSDVTLPGDWLHKIDHELQRTKADAFGGPDTCRPDFSPLLKAIDYSMTSFLTTGGMRGKKGKKLAKYYPRTFNMGVHKNLVKQTGGFSHLRFGEDIEFSHRLHKHGAKVIFIDSPVFHKRRTSIPLFFKQVFNSGVARINLYKLDASMLEPIHAFPAIATAATLFLVIFSIMDVGVLSTLSKIGLWFVLCYFCLIAMSGSIVQKSLKAGLYLLIVSPMQIFGYGMGFIYNAIRRIIFNLPETKGIEKNYYGKK